MSVAVISFSDFEVASSFIELSILANMASYSNLLGRGVEYVAAFIIEADFAFCILICQFLGRRFMRFVDQNKEVLPDILELAIMKKCHTTLLTLQSQNYLTLEAVEEGDLTPNFLLP